VLPQQFALNRENLARFEWEARLLASLNHPNIATIHGLEKSDDQQFLVMELVEGETLRDRLTFEISGFAGGKFRWIDLLCDFLITVSLQQWQYQVFLV
jgi:serine/threonine protein kinase